MGGPTHDNRSTIGPIITAALIATVLLVTEQPRRSTAGEIDEQPSSVRQELVNRWDLNGDGRIDESEAELARSRMRLERAELRDRTSRRSGDFDPLTGRARGTGDAATDGMAAGKRPGASDGLILLRGRPATNDEEPLDASTHVMPGTGKSPGSKPGTAPRGAPQPGVAQSGPSRAGQLNAGRPRAAGPGGEQPGATRPPIATGGSRAGAPSARPGYGGSGPRVDLNAGRLPAGLPASRGLPPRGGFVPARPANAPLTTAAPTTAAPTTAAPRPGMRPTAPQPTLVPRSRVSAEDIGGP